MRLVRGTAGPVLLAGLLSVAGWTLGQIYSTSLLTLLVAGAAAGSVLTGMAIRRLPSWTAAPISVAVLTAYAAAAISWSAQRAGLGGGFTDIALDAVANGIPRVLSALVPVEPQPDTVLVPVVATWLAGLTAVELALRVRSMGLALIPPAAIYVGALFLVGPHRDGTMWAGLGFAALAALALAVTAQPRRGVSDPAGAIDAGVRRALRVRAAAAAGTAVALIVAIAAVASGPIRGGVGATPVDPRAYVTPPQLDTLDENPLSRISGWAVTPDQRLLDVTLSADARIRLAVLGDYDGITWRVGGVYRPAGRALPAPPAPPQPAPAASGEEAPAALDQGPVTDVTQQVTVRELGGKLLPAVDTPRHVDGVRVSLDQVSGTLIYPEGLSNGVTYTVTSQRHTPDVNLLATADVPKGPAMARYLAFAPNVPRSIDNVAQQLAAENAAPYQRALAIQDFLASHYLLDVKAPSGHAYRNLEFFLFGTGRGGGRKGTSEQFAATFALLARMVGLPSRVVVGFSGHQGTHPILASDAYAWPEVLFAGVGWVAFDPRPVPDQPLEPLEPQFEPKPEPTSPPPSEEPLPTVAPGTAGPTAPAQASEPVVGGGSVLPVVGASAGGLLVLLLAVLVLAVLGGRRALRRRRLDAASPAGRITGAWLEVDDALRLAGRPAARSQSATEVAGHAQEAAAPTLGKRHVRLPAPPIGELAAQVNAVTFGPPGGVSVDADAATRRAAAYVAELRARQPWWRRLIWTLHPGPLRWERRRR